MERGHRRGRRAGGHAARGSTASHLDALRAAGFDEQAVADVIHSAAFFNWANRLMLSLGEPEEPAGA